MLLWLAVMIQLVMIGWKSCWVQIHQLYIFFFTFAWPKFIIQSFSVEFKRVCKKTFVKFKHMSLLYVLIYSCKSSDFNNYDNVLYLCNI